MGSRRCLGSHNQYLKFDKNLTEGSLSAERPLVVVIY